MQEADRLIQQPENATYVPKQNITSFSSQRGHLLIAEVNFIQPAGTGRSFYWRTPEFHFGYEDPLISQLIISNFPISQ